MPLPGVFVVLCLLWLGLLAVTVWVWMAANGQVAVPLPGGSPMAAAPGSPSVTMAWSADSFSRFLDKLQGAGLWCVGLVLVAVVIGAGVQEIARRRTE